MYEIFDKPENKKFVSQYHGKVIDYKFISEKIFQAFGKYIFFKPSNVVFTGDM